MLKLYSNIKLRRTELGMTQEQLALKMGYSDKGMISKIEKGLVDISSSKIEEFAQVLNTTPRCLMGWDDEDLFSAPQLRPDEQQLLDGYNQLDQEDRAEVRGLVKGMLKNEKYSEKPREKKALQAKIK